MARLAAYLILVGFLLGNLLRVPFFHPNIIVTPLDFAVIILYLIAIPKFKKISIHYSLLLFTLWLFISLIFTSLNLWDFASGLAYYLRFILYAFSYIPLSNIFNRNQSNNLITALAIMFPMLGIVQYIWFPDLRPFIIYGWDEHYLRVFGTILDPNFFGLILIWSLLNLKNIYYWSLGFLVFCFTYSRSSFLSFLTSFGFWNLKIGKLFGFLGFGFLVIVSLWLLPRPDGEGVRLERTASITARTANIEYAWGIIKDHPISGVGFNLLKGNYANIDNSFLFITATSGFIGLALYLNFLFNLWQKIKSYPKLAAFFLAILVHSLFNNSQFFTPVILLFSLSTAAKKL